ncbi:unnamed protein product, partial [Brassica rapa subsp. trilocularis]
LRSSVVSVLISLISDIWVIGPYDINYIYLGRRPIKIACYLGFRKSLLRCTTARAWLNPSIK